MNLQPVIGLEIHVQLNTKTKLFSSAPNLFGSEPNTNITAGCTAQPGALPVLNVEAVYKALQLGLALHCKINTVSRFDRKSYFYPDSPRGYQITQYEKPLLSGGHLEVDIGGKTHTFAIERAHLEDDAGILKHHPSYATIDFNRAGAPLIEIVTAPCFHSAKEAVAFASTLRTLLLYLNISDGIMQEGSLRIDANVSVRDPSGPLRPKIEIKNLNSFAFLELSIDSELRRQTALYATHPDTPVDQLIIPSTYHWDGKQNILLRRKEKAEDYRYFPEPDLVPLVITQEMIEAIALPELPPARTQRYLSLGLTPHSTSVLIHDKPLSDFFDAALLHCQNPRLLCNWITVEFTGRLKGKKLVSFGIAPEHIAKLVDMIDQGRVTGPIAKAIADQMVATPGLEPEHFLEQVAYQPITSTALLEPLIDEVLAENPQSVLDYQSGKARAFAFLIGQIMKRSHGKASPLIVNDLLRKKLE